MTRALRHWLPLFAVLAGLVMAAPALRAAPAAQGAVAEEDFTIALGDGWTSQAKLTYPAGQPGPFPTLLLISNPDATMDFLAPPVIADPIYKDLAGYLTARGIAVARYNPRYVTGPGEYADADKVYAMAPPDMLADAEAALAAVKANPRVDNGRLFVFGWSLSSLAATALAAAHPELRGLALTGPISTTSREFFIEDYTKVVLPYLIGFAPDGRLTPEGLQAALDGDGGWFAKSMARYAFADSGVTDHVAVNPFFDKNGDGILDVGGEILPNLGAWVDQDPYGDYLRTLPNVYEQARNLKPAVLVLQGENDAAVRVQNTLGLREAFAAYPDFTLNVYAGVGHSLAPNRGVSYDNLTLYSEQPKADLAAWLQAHSSPAAPAQPGPIPAALPNTGGEGDVAWLLVAAVALLLVGGAVRLQV
jgi:LPXTG-motif cell wall-anchored protein